MAVLYVCNHGNVVLAIICSELKTTQLKMAYLFIYIFIYKAFSFKVFHGDLQYFSTLASLCAFRFLSRGASCHSASISAP